MNDIMVVYLRDSEDDEYDCTFIVDKAKFQTVKKDLGQLMLATEESEIPQNEYIPQDAAKAYVNEDISWYTCLYNIFESISLDVEEATFDA